MKKSGPDWGPLFLSERQRLANADADGRTATPAFVDDDIIAMMMTLLHDHRDRRDDSASHSDGRGSA